MLISYYREGWYKCGGDLAIGSKPQGYYLHLSGAQEGSIPHGTDWSHTSKKISLERKAIHCFNSKDATNIFNAIFFACVWCTYLCSCRLVHVCGHMWEGNAGYSPCYILRKGLISNSEFTESTGFGDSLSTQLHGFWDNRQATTY